MKNSRGIGVSDFAIDNNGISDINEINGINDISEFRFHVLAIVPLMYPVSSGTTALMAGVSS